MHRYAIDNDKTANLFAVIALLSIASAYLLSQFLKITGLSDALWFLDIPSVPGFMLLYYKVFDKAVWNTAFANVLGISSTPDFNGKWVGEIKSSRDAYTGVTSAKLVIKQTGSQILLSLNTHHSQSDSCLAMIFEAAPDAVIHYTYRNVPSNSAPHTMHAHEGTAKLVLSGDKQSLTGHYYTGRDRESHGEIALMKEMVDVEQK